jgi:hypothetical protein
MERKMRLSALGVLIVGLVLISISQAQEPSVLENLEDAIQEMELGELTLHFFDALTGKEIHRAIVGIENVGIYNTDSEGRISFPIPEDGQYRTIFKMEGYIQTYFNIEIVAGTLFINRFSISPELKLGALRIVLDWNEHPNDLDLHFIKENAYHISYRNKQIADDARLDRDDTNGYGPETITVNQLESDTIYRCFVYNYSGRFTPSGDQLSKSRAAVKVFGNNQLLQTFVFPKTENGNFWNVFRIEKGQIIPVNEIKVSLSGEF